MSVRRTPESLSVSATTHKLFPSPSIHPREVDHKLMRTAGQVGKVLGERWKALNEKQRAPYESKAKADKERYETEKANYNVSTLRLHVTNQTTLVASGS